MQVSEGNSTVAVGSLIRLDPTKVKGILPTNAKTLVWGEGKNDVTVAENSKAYSFLSTIDSNGTALASKLFESLSGQEVTIEDCAVSTDGCYLITGVYKGNLGYGGYRFNTKAEHNAFIVKLDQNLGLIWSETFSCSGNFQNLRITEFSGGDVVLGGAFSGALFTEAGTFSSLAEQDLFVARLNHSNGLLSWVKRFGGSGDDSISALKSEGSLIYLAGGVKKIGSKAYSFLFEIDQNGIALKSYSLKGVMKIRSPTSRWTESNFLLGVRYQHRLCW